MVQYLTSRRRKIVFSTDIHRNPGWLYGYWKYICSANLALQIKWSVCSNQPSHSQSHIPYATYAILSPGGILLTCNTSCAPKICCIENSSSPNYRIFSMLEQRFRYFNILQFWQMPRKQNNWSSTSFFIAMINGMNQYYVRYSLLSINTGNGDIGTYNIYIYCIYIDRAKIENNLVRSRISTYRIWKVRWKLRHRGAPFVNIIDIMCTIQQTTENNDEWKYGRNASTDPQSYTITNAEAQNITDHRRPTHSTLRIYSLNTSKCWNHRTTSECVHAK